MEGSHPVTIGELISGILQGRRWGLGNLPKEPTTPWGTQKQPSQLEKMSRELGRNSYNWVPSAQADLQKINTIPLKRLSVSKI